MSSICPHCSYENPDPSTFCVFCGKKLPSSSTNENASPSSPYSPEMPPSTPHIQQPIVSIEEQGQDQLQFASNQPAYPVSPAPPNAPYWGGTPSPTPPMGNVSSSAPSWGPPPTPPVPPAPDLSTVSPGQPWGPPPPPYPGPPMQAPGQQQWAPPPNAAPSSLSHMGNTTLATMRRAFAGYGTLITHRSWLVEGKQEQGETLASTVKEQLKQQRYAGSVVKVEKLGEGDKPQGEREFLALQRGSVNEFIYATAADDALYLSRATVVQPTLSYIRLGLLAILLFIVLLGPFIILGILRGIFNSSQSGISGADIAAVLGLLQQATFYAIGFSFLYSTALFCLFCLLIISLIGWLQDKDVLKYLRTNRLTDFQMDDVAMLELATDRIVRNVVNQAGVDAAYITPPAQGYQPKRKLRFI